MKQWYEILFENYGKKYDSEPFTEGTAGECDFIEEEIGRNKATRILDVGCGTGRHAIELARRGYDITGVDRSDSMLNRAREKAAAEGVNVNFRNGDARSHACSSSRTTPSSRTPGSNFSRISFGISIPMQVRSYPQHAYPRDGLTFRISRPITIR